jgi:hypothetical protein
MMMGIGLDGLNPSYAPRPYFIRVYLRLSAA